MFQVYRTDPKSEVFSSVSEGCFSEEISTGTIRRVEVLRKEALSNSPPSIPIVFPLPSGIPLISDVREALEIIMGMDFKLDLNFAIAMSEGEITHITKVLRRKHYKQDIMDLWVGTLYKKIGTF